MTTISAVMELARKLSREDQIELNRVLVDHIKHSRRIESVIAGRQFSRGDVISFHNTRHDRKMFLKVDSVKQVNLTGKECDAKGNILNPLSRGWNVTMAACTKVPA